MSVKWKGDGAMLAMDSQASKTNSRCQLKHFCEILDDLKIMDVLGEGELIRRMSFPMFNNLPNAPLDRPLFETIVSEERKNLHNQGMQYRTKYKHGELFSVVLYFVTSEDVNWHMCKFGHICTCQHIGMSHTVNPK